MSEKNIKEGKYKPAKEAFEDIRQEIIRRQNEKI